MAPLGRALELISNLLQQVAGRILNVVEAGGKLLGWVASMIEKVPIMGNAVKEFNEEMRESIALEKEAQAIRNAHRTEEVEQAKAALEAQMKRGAEEASYYARRTLSKIQKKLGFVQIR